MAIGAGLAAIKIIPAIGGAAVKVIPAIGAATTAIAGAGKLAATIGTNAKFDSE